MEEPLNLKICYERLLEDLLQVDNFVQGITAGAYRNVFLISNPVLSRSPFVSNLFHNFHFRIPTSEVGLGEVAWRLLKFYLRSFLYLFNHAITMLMARVFFRPKFQSVVNPVIIDNFLLVEPTLASNSYNEKYFPGLHDVLLRHKKNVYIFPSFYGMVSPWKHGWQLFRLIRKAQEHFITEYDLLKVPDILEVVRFICFYPFSVIQLSRSIDRSTYLGGLLAAELLKTLDRGTVHGFIRYLAGRRLAGRFVGVITVISWYENQIQQKNFYKGLKEVSPVSVIYACRTYIDYPAYLNSFVAEAEVPHGVVPDKILVNGSAYMRRSDKLEYRLGTSLRYKYLFDHAVKPNEGHTQCLLCLSYFYERNKELVKLCSDSVLAHLTIKVRAHPADMRSSRLVLPSGWVYDSSSRSKAFDDVAIIITSESGVAVEAAALGVSVIVVASMSSFTCHPMFEYGRGIIWDLVFDSIGLDSAYEHLMKQRKTNMREIRSVAEWYKSSCFIEPTEESMVRAFDLA